MKKLVIVLVIANYIFIFSGHKNEAKASTVLDKKQTVDRSNYTIDEINTIEVFKQAVPSVVNISVISNTRSYESAVGSGFVWDNLGHIITNFHVINDSNNFLVTFHNDKNFYEAFVVGSSPAKDIAVLKLKTRPTYLKPLLQGKSSDLLIGQKTMAIGNPFGLGHSISTGIVSSLGRVIKAINGVDIADIIQTDAAINPGNSGGPLIDSRGEVIGMNTAIFSQSGNSAGIGFAVPIDTISRVVPQLIKHGKEIRPVLGVILLNDNITRDYFGIVKGVMIEDVIENSPADKAKLQGIQKTRYQLYLGDIIIAIDKHNINNYSDIYSVLSKYKIGDKVTVSLIRNQKLFKVSLSLASNN